MPMLHAELCAKHPYASFDKLDSEVDRLDGCLNRLGVLADTILAPGKRGF